VEIAELPRRIVVIGDSCAGKTTLAKALAARLGYPHVELDALNWEPGWRPAPREEFRARISAALAAESWVVDGNYSVARDLIWGRADTLIWLDYPLRVTLPRLLQRTLRRSWTGEELWNGNREQLRELFTRDSLLLYSLKTHHHRRRQYRAALSGPDFPHLHWVRLRTPTETDAWLRAFLASGPGQPFRSEG
jgi:adenylate kinase family enzyme